MIDILIPTYNRAHTILESIDSALNQINVSVNVHVIDNNSSDNTLDLIKKKISIKVMFIKISIYTSLMIPFLCI